MAPSAWPCEPWERTPTSVAPPKCPPIEDARTKPEKEKYKEGRHKEKEKRKGASNYRAANEEKTEEETKLDLDTRYVDGFYLTAVCSRRNTFFARLGVGCRTERMVGLFNYLSVYSKTFSPVYCEIYLRNISILN